MPVSDSSAAHEQASTCTAAESTGSAVRHTHAPSLGRQRRRKLIAKSADKKRASSRRISGGWVAGRKRIGAGEGDDIPPALRRNVNRKATGRMA